MKKLLFSLISFSLYAQSILAPIYVQSDAVWYDAAWAYRKQITINPNSISNVANFPFYIPLAGDSDLTSYAKSDGSDIVFTADDGTTVIPYEIVNSVPGLVAQNGGWCWFSDPRGIRYSGTNDQTYMSWISNDGYLWVTSYNHSTKATNSFQVHAGAWQVDDHDTPSLLVLSDGKLEVFFGQHGGSAVHRRTTNAENITAWGTEYDWSTVGITNTTGHSYAMPFRLSSESNKIYIFFRMYPSNYLGLVTTTEADLGTNTWNTAAVQWIDTGYTYPYYKFVSNNTDTIYAAGGDFPGNTASNIYFAKLTGGNWYKADGTLIEALSAAPMAQADMDLVYNNTSNGRAWIQDIAIDGSGNPWILFATFPGSTTTSVSTINYKIASWNGSAWVVNQIVDAGTSLYSGQVFYTGGAALARSNPSTVYLSTNASPRTSRYLERWTTSDRGANWDHTVLDSSGDNIRPFAVWGSTDTDPYSAVYAKGTYTSYTVWSTNLITPYPVARLSNLSGAFVKTNIFQNSSSNIYMYFGNSNPTDHSAPATVWSAWDIAASLTESDIGVFSADSKLGRGMTYGSKFRPSPTDATGKFGRALYYTNTAAGPYWPASALNIAGDTQATLSAWVKTNAANGSGIIASNWPSSGTKAAFNMRVGSTNKQFECYVETNTPANFGCTFTGPSACTAISDGNWHNAVCQYDGSGAGWTAMVDGTACTPTCASSAPLHGTASGQLFIGYNPLSVTAWTGYLNRFQYARTLIDTNYLKVQYWNLNAPYTSSTFGSIQSR